MGSIIANAHLTGKRLKSPSALPGAGVDRDSIYVETRRLSRKPHPKEKFLEMHGLEHWTHFYTNYGYGLQKRFFDRYLKGIEKAWSDEPRVHLQIRYPGNRFVERGENEWPIARTQWTKFYLDAEGTAPDARATTESLHRQRTQDSVTGLPFCPTLSTLKQRSQALLLRK